MNVYRKRPLFNRRSESNIYRMFLWVILILAGIWMIREVRQGDIKPLFLPTAPPTRVAKSYAMEGDAQFIAGNLDAAITAYRESTRLDPSNAELWAQLARIQAYSTQLLTTDPERKARLAEALESGKKAVELAPDDSTAHAIYAFVLDWNANSALVRDDRQVQKYLTDAYLQVTKALQLEPGNALALAFNAEILVDQQSWTQADQSIRQALERGPSLMDVHRVHAYVLESGGEYTLAIEAYKRAIDIAPNLTFLYLRTGANYRRLAFESPNEDNQKQLYEKSLDYFAKCAQINAQFTPPVKDPIPYLSIAKTYSQMGEFFIAARNVQKALEFQPENADVYGQLGIIYYKSRNYEGSIKALKCVVRGCTPEESCDGRGGCGKNDTPAQVTGLALAPSTVVYYYIYGSALAGLSRPKANRCPEALEVLGDVKAEFGDDRDIAGIVAEGELICASVGTGANTTNGAQPQVTVDPGLILETPTPTVSP